MNTDRVPLTEDQLDDLQAVAAVYLVHSNDFGTEAPVDAAQLAELVRGYRPAATSPIGLPADVLDDKYNAAWNLPEKSILLHVNGASKPWQVWDGIVRRWYYYHDSMEIEAEVGSLHPEHDPIYAAAAAIAAKYAP